LYIAFFFPPSRASGVYRALATAREFVDSGWKVTVVTATEDFFHREIGTVDWSLVELIPKEIEVVRIPFSLRGLSERKDLREYSRFHANFVRLHNYRKAKLKVPRYFKNLKNFISGKSNSAFITGEHYASWIEPTVKAIRNVDKRNRIDYILATGNPFSSFEVARVASALTLAPFSVDYRDPWTIDVFSGEKAKLKSGAFRTEAAVIAQCSNTFHINHAIADEYKKLYPDSASKQVVVPNGFDLESLSTTSRNYEVGPIIFGILGTLNNKWPFGEILQAWISIRGDLPPGSELRLGGYLGYFAHSENSLKDFLPDISDGFRYVGPIHKREVSKFYESTSIIIIPAPGGPMVTTGKVYEAAVQPIPIVCVQGPDGGARAALKGRPCVFPSDPDPDMIQKAMLESVISYRSMSSDVLAEIETFSAPYRRDLAISKMVTVLEGEMGKGDNQ
jgi:hypothetical protein